MFACMYVCVCVCVRACLHTCMSVADYFIFYLQSKTSMHTTANADPRLTSPGEVIGHV